MSNKTDNQPSPVKYLFRGAFAGVFNTIVCYPLDTVKVKLETMPIPKPGEPHLYSGSWDCFNKIIQKEGLRGLYKGISAPLAGAVPCFAFNFFNFGLGKRLIHTDVTKPFTIPELYFAGAFTGFFTAFIRTPLERVKCLLQVQDSSKPPLYKGSLDCFCKLYAEGGIRSVYKGLIVTIIKEVPAGGMFYMSYESVKQALISDSAIFTKQMTATIVSGGCAGIIYWMVALPADVIKTRLQTSPGAVRLRDVVRELVYKTGPNMLYTGFTANMPRAFPANAATFTGFELGGKIIEWVQDVVKMY